MTITFASRKKRIQGFKAKFYSGKLKFCWIDYESLVQDQQGGHDPGQSNYRVSIT